MTYTNIVGTDTANSLIANPSGSDSVTALAGNDTLVGLGGNDIAQAAACSGRLSELLGEDVPAPMGCVVPTNIFDA